MPDFNDLKALYRHLEKQIKESLENEVADEAVKTMQESIEQEVYNVYKPTQYIRRGYNGGLISDKNIKTEVNNNILSVENITTGYEQTDKEIAEIIEYGVGYTWRNSRIYQMQPFPRPFIQKTREKLEGGVAKQALEKGLENRGIDVM